MASDVLNNGKDNLGKNEKVAVIAIIVSNIDSVDKVNATLHLYKDFIIGRMGVPYKEKNINIISVVLDASIDVINNLSGKLGMIDGVNSKVLTTK